MEFLGIALLILSLAFFGIVVDMAYEIMERISIISFFIEDGGNVVCKLHARPYLLPGNV